MVAGRMVAVFLGEDIGAGLGQSMRSAVLPYWREARPLLVRGVPVVTIRAFDPPDFLDLVSSGTASQIGAGVLALANGRGQLPTRSFAKAQPVSAFPGSTGSAVWAFVFLLLMAVAGSGWTRAMIGREAHPAVLFGLSPAVGAAALILVGTIVSRLGAGLGDATAWIVWAGTSVGGAAAARAARRRAGR